MPVTVILASNRAFTEERRRRLKKRALHTVALIAQREKCVYILKECIRVIYSQYLRVGC